ncbi:hypothetical protein [Paraburkholderia atlantica]|nr:hypothetical protein [Paraburkholderia atlantica]
MKALSDMKKRSPSDDEIEKKEKAADATRVEEASHRPLYEREINSP